MVPSRTLNPVWSPDSKWVAYSSRLKSLYHAIFVSNVETGEKKQVTDGLSDAVWPAWDASGKYLWFLASTDFGLASQWLDMTSYDHTENFGVYLAILRKGEPSPLLPESDEETAADSIAKADSTAKADSAKAKASTPPKKGRQPETAAKPSTDSVTVRIDFDGLDQRILDLGLPVRSYVGLATGAAGALFVAEAMENQPGVALSRYDLKKRKAEPFLSGVALFSLSRNGKKLLYQVGDQWGIVGTETAPKPGDGKISVALPMRLDPRAEWHQIFHEAWRFERDYFYVPITTAPTGTSGKRRLIGG
jgi:tricorn protease